MGVDLPSAIWMSGEAINNLLTGAIVYINNFLIGDERL